MARLVGVVAALLLAAAVPTAGARRAGVQDHLRLRAPRGRGRRQSAAMLLGLMAASVAADTRTPGARLELEFLDMDANGDGFVDREEYLMTAVDQLVASGEDEPDLRRHLGLFLQEVWDICDLDADGLLTSTELLFARYLAASASNGVFGDGAGYFGERVAAELLESFDADGSGQVEKHEFLVRVRDPKQPGKEAAEEIFERADVTGDGVLGARELQLGLYLVNRLSASRISEALISEFDRDGDGRVDRVELIKAVAEEKPPSPSGVVTVSQLLRQQFEECDRDRDGALDEKELRPLAWHILKSQHQ